jgi:hypothetical protein
MTEVLAAPDIAAPPIVPKHLPAEIARTTLRFRDELLARFPGQIRHLNRLRHDYAPDWHISQEEAAASVADAESFIALAHQLGDMRA